ncbi:MAG: hypothetical protein HC859_13860 [Bacteroidia bacterium]|nr:hypothetical protein [Bacteroidia bacterium]
MELDEFKELWKQHDPSFEPKNEAELAAMLKGKSKSIIAKLKRSVWFELLVTIVTGLLLVYFSFSMPDGYMKWIFTSFLVMFLAYIVYYVMKLRLLNTFDASEDHLRAHLERLINDLTGYLKFYRKSYTYLYPFYFFLMLLFIEIDRGKEEFFNQLSQPKTILSLLGFCVLFSLAAIWFTNWYLKKLYGNHLEKLRNLLNDLEA